MSFPVGDIVWAKMTGYPHWPGKVVNSDDYPHIHRRGALNTVKLVCFYGTNDLAWVKVENIIPYPGDYVPKKSKSNRKMQVAIKQANRAVERKAKGLPEESDSDEEPLAVVVTKSRAATSSTADTASSPPPAKRAKTQQVSRVGSSSKQQIATSSSAQSSQKSSNVVDLTRDDGQRQTAPDSTFPDFTFGGYTVTQLIPTNKKIGFLGYGIFARPMCENLVNSGHKVTVWSKCSKLLHGLKAEQGASPADVVAKSDITFSCLENGDESRDVLVGENGVMQSMCEGKGYVEMTTMSSGASKEIAEEVQSKGGKFLEAPFSGSRKDAEEGRLVILAGGDRSIYIEAHSCFETMGTKTFFLGELGCGISTKLVMNMLQGTFMAALGECMSMAEKAGLDQYTLLEVLSMSDVSCNLMKSKGQAILEGHFPANYPIKQQQNNMRLALEMGEELEQPLHVAGAANELYKRTKAMGYGDRDVACVYRAVNA